MGMLVAAIMAMICVLVHFEALSLLDKYTRSIRRFRLSLLTTWAGLLAAHVLEIWLYALAYWLCEITGIGSLKGTFGTESAVDYAYFSSVVYTTLGFGDIIPEGGVRILAGSEALVGLCLIAWSATITYSHVQSWQSR